MLNGFTGVHTTTDPTTGETITCRSTVNFVFVDGELRHDSFGQRCP